MRIKIKVLRGILDKIHKFQDKQKQTVVRMMKDNSEYDYVNNVQVPLYRKAKKILNTNSTYYDAWKVISKNIDPNALMMFARHQISHVIPTPNNKLMNNMYKFYGLSSSKVRLQCESDEEKWERFMRKHGFIAPDINFLSSYDRKSTDLFMHRNINPSYLYITSAVPYKISAHHLPEIDFMSVDDFISKYKLLKQKFIWDEILTTFDKWKCTLVLGPNYLFIKIKKIVCK